jgi:hypothetical protein
MSNLKQEIETRVKLFFELLKSRYNLTTSLRCRKEISKHLEWEFGAYQVDRELTDLIKDSGLEYLGAGGSRLVLSYGDYAIKIERWSDDESAENRSLDSENLNEFEFYNEFRNDSDIRLLLVPIIHSFRCNKRLVLVYPKLKTYLEVDLDLVLTSSYNRKKEAVINSRFIDIQENNLGFYKGEVFYLDYNIEGLDKYYDSGLYAEHLRIWKRSSACIRRSLGYVKEMEGML